MHVGICYVVQKETENQYLVKSLLQVFLVLKVINGES